jgi:hypothetical protein
LALPAPSHVKPSPAAETRTASEQSARPTAA